LNAHIGPAVSASLFKAVFVYLIDELFDVAGRRDLGYDIAEHLQC
jgi:hypothetical protein